MITFARFDGPNRIVISRMPTPACLPGFVLVKVISSGICGSDILMYTGIRDQHVNPPGHEFSGVVVDVGKHVHDFSVGDRVCMEAFSHCGHCPECLKGKHNLCTSRVYMPHTGPSGFSEIALVPASALYLLPEEVDFELGSLVEPLAVGLHALNQLPDRPPRHLLIIGAGTIGLSTLLCAKSQGFESVWIVAKYPHQETLAKRYGVRGVIYPHESILDVIGDEPDAIISTSTSGSALSQAISSCRIGGTIVLLGGFTSSISVNLSPMISKELNLIGSICYATSENKSEFQTIIDWLKSGRIKARSLITHRFSFDDIALAFETAQKRYEGAVKVNIRMSKCNSRWMDGQTELCKSG